MNVAIVFAKGPEKSSRNINMYLVGGYPVVYYPINAALSSKAIEKVFVSTNNREIAEIAKGVSCLVIKRPDDLGGMGKAIVYIVKKVIEKYSSCKNIVVLSGNNVMVSSYLIEKSLKVLEEKKEVQSVITVWKSKHDHPRSALILKDGFIKPFLEKDSGEAVYFYDGSVCAIRREIIGNKCFQDERWWAKLPNCLPLVRSWPTGRDVHNSYDLALARWWIENSPIDTARVTAGEGR